MCHVCKYRIFFKKKCKSERISNPKITREIKGGKIDALSGCFPFPRRPNQEDEEKKVEQNYTIREES
jgi:hypothetical protein